MKIGEEQNAVNAFEQALEINPKMRTVISQLYRLGEFTIFMKSIKEIYVEYS